MNKFIAILSAKNTQKFTERLLQEHIDHLQKLHDQKLLVICGPFADDDSALQIVLAEDLAGAEQLLQQDPFIQQRYYQKIELRELIEANPGNNWLASHKQTEEKRYASQPPDDSA